MRALGLLPIATIEAKIQTAVATFLAKKEILLKLTKHPSPSISSKAVGLMAAQQLLEKELNSALAKIDMIKSGAYTYSDIINVTTFAFNMENHVKDVKKLENEAGTAITTIPGQKAPTSLLLGGGIALASLYMFFKK